MDVLIITGMPRSGTTFLHQVFSGWRFPGFWAVLNKDVPRTGISHLWKTGECPAIGKVLLDEANPMPALREMVSMWRAYVSKVYGYERATVVYKQPQFCFTKWLDWIVKDPLLKVGFVLCRRDMNGWIESMNSIGPGSSNNVYWKVIWNGPFDYPYEEQERLKYFYNRLDICVKEVSKKIPKDRRVSFDFEMPENSLGKVLDFTGIHAKASNLTDKFWIRDQSERIRRNLTDEI